MPQQRRSRADKGADAPPAALVRLLSLQTGRDDLVGAARKLCEQVAAGNATPADVDEDAVEAHLTANAAFPPPELVLQFCPELLLGGLLPWHCRVTQYVLLGELHSLCERRLKAALVEHAGVQQRHGL